MMGKEIWNLPGGPVKACYPCSFVQTYYIHYPSTSQEVYINTGPGKAWKCPGGKLPPAQCPDGLLQSADGAECVCKPGWYPDTPTTCKLCEPGYKCAGGMREQCPAHYYQAASGTTECFACNSLGTRFGFYRCTVRGQLLKFCTPGVNGTQNRPLQQNCIPCNQCRRAYSNTEDGLLTECYRDN